jgi:hypothetical protein
MKSCFELPTTFLGIDTDKFTDTFHYRKNRKNAFVSLSEKALDPNISWNDRTQTIRYMQNIPYINKYNIINKCMESILTDNQYSYNDRYFFFSNNEALIKLNYEIVNYCHKYIYDNFETLKYPFIYKILSSQYILTQFTEDSYDSIQLQNFLLDTSRDKNMSVNIRAECADILHRSGYKNFKNEGYLCIQELGELYIVNKKSHIYTNSQNVHDLYISKSVISVLHKLVNESYNMSEEIHSGLIYNDLVNYNYKSEEEKENTLGSFKRILIDTGRYDGYTILKILLMVYNKINNSNNKEELFNRMIQELTEMDSTCSTGHLSRVLNILSGYFPGYSAVNISYEDQLKSNIFGRLTKSISDNIYSQYIQEEILENNKPYILEFMKTVEFKNIKKELMIEFVDSSYLYEYKFMEIYNSTISNYFGFNTL